MRRSFATQSSDNACVRSQAAETECLAHGARQVVILENDAFAVPRPDLFAAPLVAAVTAAAPFLPHPMRK